VREKNNIDAIANKMIDVTKGFVELYNLTARKLYDEHSITMSESRILTGIDAEKNISINSLADELGLSKGRVSRVVESLRKKGLIEKEENKEDRRYYNIKLTPEGREVRNQFIVNRLQLSKRILSKVDDDILCKLVPIFEVLTEALDED